MLKSKSDLDFILYALTPWAYINYSLYLAETKKLYERGFPAHPVIQAARTDVINKSCFSYPQIVKNEIEYLHMKLCQGRKKAEKEPSAFIKDFQTGETMYDYKRLLTARKIFNNTTTAPG